MEWCEKLYVNYEFGKIMHRMFRVAAVLLLLCLIFTGSGGKETVYRSGERTESGRYAAGTDSMAGTVVNPMRDNIYAGTYEALCGAAVQAAGISAVNALPPVLSILPAEIAAAEKSGSTETTSVFSPAGAEKTDDAGSSLSAAAVPDDTLEVPSGITVEETDNISPVLPEEIPQETPAKPEDIPADSGTVSEGAKPQMAEVEGFLVDGTGTICGIADEGEAVKNGYLRLPSKGCSAVAADAFLDLSSEVIEVYIPANITYIAEGAFSGFDRTEWFSTDSDGTYISLDGVLFSEDGTCLLAFPAGRIGIYKVPSEVVRFAPGAFEGASISKLDMRKCNVKDMGNIPAGIEIL